MNYIVETYSKLAALYDDEGNVESCWGKAADRALASIRLKEEYRTVVDVGCGTGKAIAELAAATGVDTKFVGVEPALNMRSRAIERTNALPNVQIVDGSFENMPFESASVDYLFSILAFHWTTNLERSVEELARVLKPNSEMDLFFIGRYNGAEFVRKTTPIFLQAMGPIQLLRSAQLRKQITRDAAEELFLTAFARHRLTVDESLETYYDTLEGHWSWWVRIEGHFIDIPADQKQETDRRVKQALAGLETEDGIPYSIHLLHVRLRS